MRNALIVLYKDSPRTVIVSENCVHYNFTVRYDLKSFSTHICSIQMFEVDNFKIDKVSTGQAMSSISQLLCWNEGWAGWVIWICFKDTNLDPVLLEVVPQVIFLLWSARLSKNVTFSISQMMFLFRVWEEARLKNYRFCVSRWRGKKQRDKESQQQPLASAPPPRQSITRYWDKWHKVNINGSEE